MPTIQLFETCTLPGCDRKHAGYGFCAMHYYRIKRGGDAFQKKRIIGNGHIHKSGYKYIYVKGKPIREHRHFMQQFLGRKLKKNEVVHHKNGNKLDNRIDNLEIMTQAEHTHHHQPRRKNYPKHSPKCSKCDNPYRCKGLCRFHYNLEYYHKNKKYFSDYYKKYNSTR